MAKTLQPAGAAPVRLCVSTAGSGTAAAHAEENGTVFTGSGRTVGGVDPQQSEFVAQAILFFVVEMVSSMCCKLSRGVTCFVVLRN